MSETQMSGYSRYMSGYTGSFVQSFRKYCPESPSKFKQASSTLGVFLTSCIALETNIIVDQTQTLES
jgi:hypothetical protein